MSELAALKGIVDANRLYRATAGARFVLGENDERIAVPL